MQTTKLQTILCILAVCIGVAPLAQVTHVRNKSSNIQGRSLKISDFLYYKELLIKERIRSLSGSEFFPLREVPISKKERNCRESLSDSVVSL